MKATKIRQLWVVCPYYHVDNMNSFMILQSLHYSFFPLFSGLSFCYSSAPPPNYLFLLLVYWSISKKACCCLAGCCIHDAKLEHVAVPIFVLEITIDMRPVCHVRFSVLLYSQLFSQAIIILYGYTHKLLHSYLFTSWLLKRLN